MKSVPFPGPMPFVKGNDLSESPFEKRLNVLVQKSRFLQDLVVGHVVLEYFFYVHF